MRMGMFYKITKAREIVPGEGSWHCMCSTQILSPASHVVPQALQEWFLEHRDRCQSWTWPQSKNKVSKWWTALVSSQVHISPSPPQGLNHTCSLCFSSSLSPLDSAAVSYWAQARNALLLKPLNVVFLSREDGMLSIRQENAFPC